MAGLLLIIIIGAIRGIDAVVYYSASELYTEGYMA
jgi:hypothetical protein